MEVKCGICLSQKELKKCNKCVFEACEPCIIAWYDLTIRNKQKEDYNHETLTCPGCRSRNSFGIEYEESSDSDEEESSDSNEEVVNRLTLQEGYVNYPEGFLMSWDRLSDELRNIWNYVPMHMQVGIGAASVVGYRITREKSTIETIVDSVPQEIIDISNSEDLTEEQIAILCAYLA